MPFENNILENNTLEDETETVQINNSNETIINNEYSNSNANASNAVLSITNFENVKSNSLGEFNENNITTQNANYLEVLNTLPLKNSNNLLAGGNKETDTNNTKDTKDTKDSKDSKDINDNVQEDQEDQDDQKNTLLEDNSKEDHSENQDGGAISDGIVYEIDFLVADDKELIDITKVNNTVDKYINNFNSEELKKYKQSFKNLYQKYSNKRYIINNIGYVITVVKDEKKKDIHKNMKDMKNKDIVMELKKPQYLYYNNSNCNLDILKMEISNDRVKLQYLYQTLVNKLNVSLDEKKDFEKQRKKFIEFLETYYIYTLYHKKINKISTTNKVNIIIQELLGDNNLLESNIYSVDNSLIDLINKQNASKLNEFNNLVSKMQSIKNIKDDKKILETIKEYLNKNETNKLLDSIKLNAKQQDNYIDYIITELP